MERYIFLELIGETDRIYTVNKKIPCKRSYCHKQIDCQGILLSGKKSLLSA